MIKARITNIDPRSETIKVCYEDPHGHEPHETNIMFEPPYTPEGVMKSVIRFFPKRFFDMRARQKAMVAEIDDARENELKSLIGIELNIGEAGDDPENIVFSPEVY